MAAECPSRPAPLALPEPGHAEDQNAADLLRRLGDPGPADLLDTAADQAPDAPPGARHPAAGGPRVDRAAALEMTRHAIAGHLRGR